MKKKLTCDGFTKEDKHSKPRWKCKECTAVFCTKCYKLTCGVCYWCEPPQLVGINEK